MDVTDFVAMFRHWQAGRYQVQISKALGIDRKTLRKYVALDHHRRAGARASPRRADFIR